MTPDIEVYVDDLDVYPVRAGLLRPSFTSGRVLASSSFQYDPVYLEHPRGYAISGDLPLTSGRLFAPSDRTLFGAFADAAPDEWGRKIIEADFAVRRKADASLPRRPGQFDLLMSVSDFTRMGALRFRRPNQSDWLASDPGVADVHDLARVIAVASRYENDEASDEDVAYLSDVANSPGGARRLEGRDSCAAFRARAGVDVEGCSLVAPIRPR